MAAITAGQGRAARLGRRAAPAWLQPNTTTWQPQLRIQDLCSVCSDLSTLIQLPGVPHPPESK